MLRTTTLSKGTILDDLNNNHGLNFTEVEANGIQQIDQGLWITYAIADFYFATTSSYEAMKLGDEIFVTLMVDECMVDPKEFYLHPEKLKDLLADGNWHVVTLIDKFEPQTTILSNVR